MGPVPQPVFQQNYSADECELTILMPCLNEAETIAECIGNAQGFLARSGISGEVLIADNGSSDASRAIAARLGARVVQVEQKGYGSALLGGIRAARGRYIIMGDADGSYDFGKLEEFVIKLRDGADLVMGNRFRGGILPGAMPWLHRYLGNPVLSQLGRLFFYAPVGDFQCGLRGFNRRSIHRMDLQSTGMEFASEMVVKSALNRLRIAEVPATLSPDGRSRRPHLRTWRDGWRHLRFLLIYCPRWLFLYPGLLLAGVGALLLLWLAAGSRRVLGVELDIHTMLAASGFVLLGIQAVMFHIFAKSFAITLRLLPPDQRFEKLLSRFSLEHGLVLGAALLVAGLIGAVLALLHWERAGFGPQNPVELMRIEIPAITAAVAGVQAMFGSFFLGVLRLAGPYSESTGPELR
jgi:glycosyltransferase involved in cell wall biosynthesis